jgi:hypothetical protein
MAEGLFRSLTEMRMVIREHFGLPRTSHQYRLEQHGGRHRA